MTNDDVIQDMTVNTLRYIYSPEKDRLIYRLHGSSHAELEESVPHIERRSYRFIGKIYPENTFDTFQLTDDNPPEDEFQSLVLKLWEYPMLFRHVGNARYIESPWDLSEKDQVRQFPEYFGKTIRELVDMFSKD